MSNCQPRSTSVTFCEPGVTRSYEIPRAADSRLGPCPLALTMQNLINYCEEDLVQRLVGSPDKRRARRREACPPRTCQYASSMNTSNVQARRPLFEPALACN